MEIIHNDHLNAANENFIYKPVSFKWHKVSKSFNELTV